MFGSPFRMFDNKTSYIDNMAVLVKRDRNHPSVVIWSFCNEGACEGHHETGGYIYYHQMYHVSLDISFFHSSTFF